MEPSYAVVQMSTHGVPESDPVQPRGVMLIWKVALACIGAVLLVTSRIVNGSACLSLCVIH